MVKNLSYREKLLELSRIYKISEIQNYIKRKKNLTTSQIEHILKKNKVPIPKDFNVSFFEKNFSKPLSKAGKNVTGFYGDTSKGLSRMVSKTGKGATGIYDNTTSGIASFFVSLWRGAGLAGLNVLNIIPKLISTIYNFFGDLFVNTFSSFYDQKIEEKKAGKIVAGVGYIAIIGVMAVLGYTVIDNFKEDKLIFETKKQDEQKIEKKIETNNEKKQNKSELKPKKELAKLPKKEIKPDKEKTKDPSQVKELVLPNLNLKTDTVLSLFKDVEYDLKQVRYQKKVKPIYFTQFPKDLDEIT